MAWQPQFYGEGHSFEKALIPEGIEQGCRWEAFCPTPYKDKHKSGFKWAIGFGHVFGGETEPKEFKPDLVITRDEALVIFTNDMDIKMRWLRKKIKVPVTSYMFNALGLLCLNTGEGNMGRGPVLALLNAERYVGASAAFMFHSKSWQQVKDETGAIILAADGKPKTELKTDNGLVVRRACEIALFSTKKD